MTGSEGFRHSGLIVAKTGIKGRAFGAHDNWARHLPQRRYARLEPMKLDDG